MDYTREPLAFRLRKATRYVRLYGPRRTLAKIKGQYHMRRRFAALPEARPDRGRGHVGIIGCGSFAFSAIAFYLCRNRGRVIRGAMDIDEHRAASLARQYGADYYTPEAERIIDDPDIDLVYIASNHASHAEYAIAALRAGKAVHVEKPHVVSYEQLRRLCLELQSGGGRLRLGFNRPQSPMGRAIKDSLDSQAGPSMMSWFIAGHELPPDHWYFSEDEGGRILGNLCHWTDFVLQMVDPGGRFPIRITPTRSDKSDCDIAVTFVFGDQSIAAITFSAKGHTFEGVRERFAAHRGNVLISLEDFGALRIDDVARRRVWRPWFRDHGHEASIMASYAMADSTLGYEAGSSAASVWETGALFLETKKALETHEQQVLGPYEPDPKAAAPA